MAEWTLTLNEIDFFLGGKDQSPRPTGIGVYKECDGELQATYLGETFSRADIEALLLDEYAMCESAFETVEMFQWRWRNVWNRHFPLLVQNLGSAPDISLSDYTITREREYGEKSSGTSESTGSSTTDSSQDGTNEDRFSNTPNQLVQNTFNGLTTLNNRKANETGSSKTDTTANGSANSSKEGTDNSTDTHTRNTFLKWLSISEQNRNIIYDFFDKFDELFLRSAGICNYSRRYFYDVVNKGGNIS